MGRLVDNFRDLVAVHCIDGEADFLGVSEEAFVAERRRKGLAQDGEAVSRQAGWGHIGLAERRRRGKKPEYLVLLIVPGELRHQRNVGQALVAPDAGLDEEVDLVLR